MMKEINFDMDGTIANLYGEENWLSDLINEKTTPYENAKPMVNMNSLARILNRLIANGYSVNIISWTSKNGTEEYNARVETAKKIWLSKHLKSVNFTAIKILPYGEPKQNHGNGILFDDEEPNRRNWNGIAYDEKNIIKILKEI